MPAHRKPIEQHLSEGTFVPSRHAARLDKPKADPLPKAPAHLNASERQAWNEIAAAAPRGALTAADFAIVESAATALAAFRFWQAQARKVDPIDDGERGTKIHPAWTELRRARAQLNEALVHCALTPATRARIVVTEPQDPLDGWHHGLNG